MRQGRVCSTAETLRMGNCCGCERDSGQETVLVRQKFACPMMDRSIFGIDRYISARLYSINNALVGLSLSGLILQFWKVVLTYSVS